MRLLYLHGSTLQAFVATGKIRFLDALNPGGMFEAVHLVNLDPDAAADVEREEGAFRLTSIGLARLGTGRWAKWRALRRAVVALSADRPALVLADDANLLGLTARRVARRARVPYAVCVYYDNDLHYRLTQRPALDFLRTRTLESVLERLVFRGAAGVYAGTRAYLEYGCRHGADPAKAYLANWSVDDIFYDEPPPPHPDSREVFFAGRLHPLKFIDDLIEALARLPAEIRLDVAGEGHDRERLEALAAARGVAGRVRLLGLVPREDLRARMQGARVLVGTQGVSAVVEGLLSGRPLVAYDHECNREFVRDGETGLLVPFRDVPRLVGALQRLFAEPDLGRRLGARARERMIAEHGIAASVEHRRRFFERCLGP